MSSGTRFGAVLAALALSSLAGCGGGGGDPPGSCTRAAIPTTGPGDVDSYFPADVNRTWTYQVTETGYGSYQFTNSVIGTTPVGTETAYVFTTTDTIGGYSSQLIVKRLAGVYELSDGSAEPPLDQLYPSPVLPFPVVDQPPTLVVSCSNVAIADLDGDGKGDHMDLTAYLGVHTGETASVGAGDFTDVANVQTDLTITVNGSSGASMSITTTKNEWYAPGTGRVSVYSVLSAPAAGVYDEMSAGLQSLFVPAVGAVPTTELGLAVGAPLASRPASFAEASVQLARSLIHVPGHRG